MLDINVVKQICDKRPSSFANPNPPPKRQSYDGIKMMIGERKDSNSVISLKDKLGTKIPLTRC